MEVVINGCYGGFCLSREGFAEYARLKGIDLHARNAVSNRLNYYAIDIERNDSALVQTVKNLGRKASGVGAYLYIVEIPDGVEWEIEEYDGLEHVAEQHRTWG